jgi:hypothetical protein
LFIALENSLGEPFVKKLSDSLVRAGFLAQVQTDEIVGRFLVEALLLRRRNDIVGGGDYLGDIADLLLIVKDATKRRDT